MMTTATTLTTQLKCFKKTANKKQKGFTLIELAIIIAIVGIMSAVAVTQFIDLTGNAEEAVLSDYLQKLNTGVASYMAATGHRPDSFADFVAATPADITPSSGLNIAALTDKNGNAYCGAIPSDKAGSLTGYVCAEGALRSKQATYSLNRGAITMTLANKTGAGTDD
jgi:prepilin-type N-terminal cleavage/methylation domain-containing protein